MGLPASVRICALAWSRINLLVALGDAEQRADHPHRHDGAEVFDEVEPAGAYERVEGLRAVLANLGFESVDLAGREHPRQQLAMSGMDRRVLEDQCTRRDLDVG